MEQKLLIYIILSVSGLSLIAITTLRAYYLFIISELNADFKEQVRSYQDTIEKLQVKFDEYRK